VVRNDLDGTVPDVVDHIVTRNRDQFQHRVHVPGIGRRVFLGENRNLEHELVTRDKVDVVVDRFLDSQQRVEQTTKKKQQSTQKKESKIEVLNDNDSNKKM
jgi:hypothetical protein